MEEPIIQKVSTEEIKKTVEQSGFLYDSYQERKDEEERIEKLIQENLKKSKSKTKTKSKESK